MQRVQPKFKQCCFRWFILILYYAPGTKYLQGRLLSGVSVYSLGYTQIDKGLSACVPGLVAWLKSVNERPFYVVYKFYQISMILDSLNKIRKQHLDVKWRINVLFKFINISTLLLTHKCVHTFMRS